jgi:hypothetical protein
MAPSAPARAAWVPMWTSRCLVVVACGIEPGNGGEELLS